MSRRAPLRPPDFFIDRSLGRVIVPQALTAVGLTVHTLASIYGEQEGQLVSDEIWLRESGRQNWVVLMKDDAIRRRPAEIEALVDARVRAFCLTNAQLRGQEQAARLVHNRHRILQAASRPGPFIYGVYANRLERLWPR